MRITADTNVLVRAVMQDDPKQAKKAAQLLTNAELVAISLPSLCELVWVLRSVYKASHAEIDGAISALLAVPNVQTNKPAVEAGLAALRLGGDFADGVIAFEGQWLGAESFASFDKQAIDIMKTLNVPIVQL